MDFWGSRSNKKIKCHSMIIQPGLDFPRAGVKWLIGTNNIVIGAVLTQGQKWLQYQWADICPSNLCEVRLTGSILDPWKPSWSLIPRSHLRCQIWEKKSQVSRLVPIDRNVSNRFPPKGLFFTCSRGRNFFSVCTIFLPALNSASWHPFLPRLPLYQSFTALPFPRRCVFFSEWHADGGTWYCLQPDQCSLPGHRLPAQTDGVSL